MIETKRDLAKPTEPIPYAQLRSMMVCRKTGKLYVFGYGSLIWKPNFPYSRSWVGYIEGYKRRFYQGTTTHRGTPKTPGRVATLISSNLSNSRVWGVAFEVSDPSHIDVALEHLAEREMILGGYRFDQVQFHGFKQRSKSFDPKIDGSKNLVHEINPSERTDRLNFMVQVYIAQSNNDQYIGNGPIELQAYQIANAKGICGPNYEYLFKICHFMKTEVPADEAANEDAYLLLLEHLVQEYLENKRNKPESIESAIDKINLSPDERETIKSS